MRIFQVVTIVAALIACSAQTVPNSSLWPFLLQGRNNINGITNSISAFDQQQTHQQIGSGSDVRPRQQQQFSVVHPEANNLLVQPTVSSENTMVAHHNVSNQTGTVNVTLEPKNNNNPDRHTGLFNFGAEVNAIITAVVALLGAAMGRQGCDLKAACLAGTFVPEVQGREMALIFAEALVPPEWKETYNAAKVSIIQRKDCSRFSCF